MGKFKVAGIQMVCKPGDEPHNLAKAFRLIDKAAAKGAALVCLPELFSTGYDLHYIRKHARKWPDDIARELGAKAEEQGVYLIAGVPVRAKEGIFNCAALWHPDGRLQGIVSKSHLMPIREMPETEHFQRGEPEGRVFETGIGNIGIMICFDLRFPELARKMALKGAELIVVPSAWGKARVSIFTTLAAARAIENQLYVFAVGRAGKDGKTAFAGHTALYDPLGNPVRGFVEHNKEAIVISEVDLGRLGKARGFIDTLGSRHPKYGI